MALGRFTSQPIAGLARVVGNGDYDGFFRQLNRDNIVREALQNKALCISIASFFGER